jgi:hypothetical protein
MGRHSPGIDRQEQVEHQQSTCLAPPSCASRDDNDGTAQSDDSDHVDYSDYADDGDDTSAGSNMEACYRNETPAVQEVGQLIAVCKDEAMVPHERYQQDTAVISVINRHQMPASRPSEEIQGLIPYEDNIARAKQNDASLQRKRCPHHPHARLVRFDPAGQAWCDRMDCWDCYRLMKIGEALSYCCVTDQGGNRLLNQGREAWTAFTLSQGSFMVMSATQEVIAICKSQGVEVPDLSGEVQQLVEVYPASS